MSHKILLIDDDKDLCHLLKQNLEDEQYDVTVQHDGASGLKKVLSSTWQLIILDVMLPKMNGFDVLLQIRQQSNVPILMLTAKDSEGDKVSGLRMGADDYLTKPFSNSEFLARAASLLRRYTQFNSDTQETDAALEFDGLRIDPLRREVYAKEQLKELTAKEFDLLWFLASNPGQVFTKRQIYCAVWEEDYAYDDNNIMVHIRRLRKKIEENPASPVYIATVWGVGYKFGGCPL